MRAGTLWLAGAGVVGGYALLFALARRPVTLRLPRLGGLLATIVVLRLLLIVLGLPLEDELELAGTVLAGVAAVALLLARGVWLVRIAAEELHEQIQTACRGLFLGVKELQPGFLELVAPGGPVLRLWKLAPRLQLLVYCRATGPGKVALLCKWLTKQFPGPVPRLRFVLKGGAP
jgi:hypothetical protein